MTACIYGCKNHEISTDSTNNIQKEKTTTANQLPSSSKGSKIQAVLIAINPVLDSTDLNSPCAKAPCNATIRVRSISRGASNSNHFINMGDTLNIIFTFTLSPTTKDLFPNMTAFYPGLKINDKFEGIIEDRRPFANNNDKTMFWITHYKKID